MADHQGGGGGGSTSGGQVREYRKGNWTISETMVLIEAKKMDDERRMKRAVGSDSAGGEAGAIRASKPAELRWKWVEDYCWGKGCLRSQNQCNDKWDNLMRDYKKVRDYDRKLQQQDHQTLSYWKIEKSERKDKNLPTNMLPQIYEALLDVVEKKPERAATSSVVPHFQQVPLVASQALLATRQHVSSPAVMTAAPIPALPAPPAPSPIQQVHPVVLPYSHPILPTVDSDTSEHSDSPAKRRRKSKDHGEQGTTSASPRNVNTTTLSSSPSPTHELASAISKSASVIAEALLASGEREERRHRDLVSLHEKRLKIEESKTEVNKQGISGLVDAINQLAKSIHALASDKQQPDTSSSKP